MRNLYILSALPDNISFTKTFQSIQGHQKEENLKARNTENKERIN